MPATVGQRFPRAEVCGSMERSGFLWWTRYRVVVRITHYSRDAVLRRVTHRTGWVESKRDARVLAIKFPVSADLRARLATEVSACR